LPLISVFVLSFFACYSIDSHGFSVHEIDRAGWPG
jgi:hypothetical protein